MKINNSITNVTFLSAFLILLISISSYSKEQAKSSVIEIKQRPYVELDKEKARELSRDPNVEIQILSYAEARTKRGFMAMAVVPAAKKALMEAGIGIKDIQAIKTHNPFAVNDIYFCREMGIKLEDMNNYGSSLIWGHPQGPTGTRLIIELIEELVLRGGGYGLFDGCAAGDTAAAVVIKVDVK